MNEKTMLSEESFQDNCNRFIGTKTWTRYNKLMFPRMLLTDGAKYVAEECGAYWLMDVISSVAPRLVDSGHRFMAVWMDVKEDKDGLRHATIIIDDGNWTPKQPKEDREILHRQKTFTDFPYSQIKFYVQPAEDNHIVIMLPSEY